MRIRQMTAEDIPAVAQIEKECFSQPWSEQGFLDGMKDAIFFVAEDILCFDLSVYMVARLRTAH